MSSTQWHDAIQARQQVRKTRGLWRERRLIGSAQQPLIQSGSHWLTNFSSNDYLGLAGHPKLDEAANEANNHWGCGAGASHLVCGHQQPHHLFEQELAEFVGAESAILFANGYMANLALSTAFAEKNDLLLHDRLNHASLVDGAQLSLATFKRYAHADALHAQKIALATDFDRLLIHTDGVFSMDGDIAPLIQLQALADQHSGLLCVDDAHGFGVLGQDGRGTLSEFGFRPAGNILMMGTLGKAVGSYGAFVAGDALFIEHLVQFARSYIYTTALPPAVVMAGREALKLIREQHSELSSHLWSLVKQFRRECEQCAIPLLPSNSPIQPVIVGDETSALTVSRALEASGFLVPAIRTPTVAKGHARLRVTLTAAHTKFQVSALVEALVGALSNALPCVETDKQTLLQSQIAMRSPV